MAIAIQNRRKQPRLKTAQLKEIAFLICAGLGYKRPELSVLITGDEEIRVLNRDWRAKDKATDVLSFSQIEEVADDPFAILGVTNEDVLGDIVISAETAARQAEKGGYSLEAEYRRLLVHGVLHLLGHDHIHGGRQAAKMRREEDRLLAELDSALGPA
jgi:probable rRNA maturation factor